MAKLFEYNVIREYLDGSRGKRIKKYYCWDHEIQPKINGLYVHLGIGFPGFQRVLSLAEVQEYSD